jgi:acyl-CoA thioesterase-1
MRSIRRVPGRVIGGSRRWIRAGLPLALLAGVSACSIRDAACGRQPETTATVQTEQVPSPEATPGESGGGDGGFQIVFLGDSLTAGYGLLTSQAFPALIEAKFHAEGYAEIEALNAGVSGDTTSGALRRVPQVLSPSTRILVVALGGNDALRGLTAANSRENLEKIVEIADARRIAVLLCGMEAPTNLGEDYRTAFRNIFMDLAREYSGRVAIMPFLLEGVAGDPALNQPDGIHPNAEGARLIADQMYPRLRTIVDSIAR